MINRLIKFRAWNEEKKQMLPVYKLDWSEYWPENLMQFTGLLDKNGKEIYEGDILLYKKVISTTGYFSPQTKRSVTKKRSQPKEELHYWAVSMSLKGQWIATRNGISQSLASATEKHEIVGNIYGNPELPT